MAFAIYLHRENFVPESPLIVDKNVSDANVNFTFVDFVPGVIKRSNTVIPQCEVEYHSFSAMMEVANDWLQKNGSIWQVVNCETVIFLYKYNDTTNSYELKPNDCCFYIYGSEKNNVLKGLRVWIRRRAHQLVPQVLRFRDLVPEYKKFETESRFEDLDDLIGRINDEMRDIGLEGRIITLESLSYEASNKHWKVDTECSLSCFSNKNVYILRIFYEFGEQTYERIGIQDFSPNLIRKATFFKRPTFETFDKVIERASAWLQKQTKLQFINAQSIDIKMKSSTLVNSREMTFTEHGDYARIFRITFTVKAAEAERPLPRPAILSTRLFLPYNKTDTIHDIKQRLSDWVNPCLEKYRAQLKKTASGTGDDRHLYPRIFSAETVEVFAKDFRNDSPKDIEKAANTDTFLANRFGNKNAYMFFSLRIFYDSSQFCSQLGSVISIDSAHNTPIIAKKTANLHFS